MDMLMRLYAGYGRRLIVISVMLCLQQREQAFLVRRSRNRDRWPTFRPTDLWNSLSSSKSYMKVTVKCCTCEFTSVMPRRYSALSVSPAFASQVAVPSTSWLQNLSAFPSFVLGALWFENFVPISMPTCFSSMADHTMSASIIWRKKNQKTYAETAHDGNKVPTWMLLVRWTKESVTSTTTANRSPLMTIDPRRSRSQ